MRYQKKAYSFLMAPKVKLNSDEFSLWKSYPNRFRKKSDEGNAKHVIKALRLYNESNTNGNKRFCFDTCGFSKDTLETRHIHYRSDQIFKRSGKTEYNNDGNCCVFFRINSNLYIKVNKRLLCHSSNYLPKRDDNEKC